MTENEAILKIKYRIDTATQVVGIGTDGKAYEDLEMAIKAFEEYEQYRAIGTVEELTELIKELKETYKIINEVRKLAENKIAELKEFQSIGTVEEFKALKEKNEAKKPRFYAHNYYCTECGNLVGNNEFEWQRFLYCEKC